MGFSWSLLPKRHIKVCQYILKISQATKLHQDNSH